MKRAFAKVPVLAAVLLGSLMFTVSVLTPGRGWRDDPDIPPVYTIVPFLPPDTDSISSIVTDLNDRGQAVGSVTVSGSSAGSNAVHFDLESGKYTTLGTDTLPSGLNNLNQIVGSDASGGLFWSSPVATPVRLAPLPGDVRCDAVAINDAGMVVGHSWTSSPKTGVVWFVVTDHDGDTNIVGPEKLPPLDGDVDSTVVDISELVGDAALLTGTSSGSGGQWEAVTWMIGIGSHDTMERPEPAAVLDLLDPGERQLSRIEAINGRGDVCGSLKSRPFLARYGQPARPLFLPAARTMPMGWAHDINNLGDVVGKASIHKSTGLFFEDPAGFHACLWRGSELVVLETEIERDSGWDQLSAATVINSSGIIAGYGRYDVEIRGFLLIPKHLSGRELPFRP